MEAKKKKKLKKGWSGEVTLLLHNKGKFVTHTHTHKHAGNTQQRLLLMGDIYLYVHRETCHSVVVKKKDKYWAQEPHQQRGDCPLLPRCDV